MLACEQDIEKAIRVLLNEAHLPRPENWNVTFDRTFVKYRLVPAFIKALQEIEKVDFCYGFDESKIEP